ncbi:MAG: cell division ATP-binding protein FtsE [Proteobacteria bacterium]|nr:cell division ATP-binding protein FtsE [Pseudomonadota bacterium]
MIRFVNVGKRYPGGQDALRKVDFELSQSDMALLIGVSGAGKSTLLKLISVIERPTYGQIIIDGRNLRTVKRRDIAPIRRQIGIIFQDHKLLHDRTVFDNVALSLVVAGISYRESAKRVRAALDKVGLLKKENMMPIALSGGEQQRVGIARAVVNRPAILLADEPTGNLDAALSDEIMDLFLEFNKVGTAVLIATHDLRQIERLQKPVLQLDHGKLIRNDLDGRLTAHPNHELV